MDGFLASDALARACIPRHADFHTLSSIQVEALLVEADAVKYRKPKNANGSRARYFHAFLTRSINRKS
jgi:hypothetical protein